MRLRKATREQLGLTRAEFAILRRLDTPAKIQRFLNGLKQNFEPDGDTCYSVRTVLKRRRAHCIEGATLAACALWIHGEPPLLMDLQAVRDFDHVVAVFRRRGRWGAISKTNGLALRWRDPVYRSLRELAMSYFHEYYNKRHEKTLRTYSRPFDLRRVDPAIWATSEHETWDLANALDATRHFRLTTPAQLRSLVRRDPFERRAGRELQYRPPRKASWRGRRKRR
ncbi:MAG: hypothetical protein EPO29_08235 [Betaproteobacteria bacterium]|nr:MAG: hypothetical protein EPO29_08235 [Betaproteobacteria bacterium]